jgi:hypothetical protein
MPDEGWMTAAEIADAIGASEYRAKLALTALGLWNQGKKDLRDARRIIYPPGSLEKVREWLGTH